MSDIRGSHRPFDPDVRATLCTDCSAPFEVGVEGGSPACPACGAVNLLSPRDLRPVRFAAPADERERLARLRTQDGKPLLPPPGIEGLCDGGALLDWKVEEATFAWRDARREARATASPAAEERLAFLTLLLQNKQGEQVDRFRNRAFLESVLEAVVSPRFRQEFLGRLSRAACRAGDVRAAERWLELCDPRPDDLPADSDWRVSRAYIDTAQRDWAAVLRVLGEPGDEVPIQDSLDNFAGVLRANALERSGRVDAAVEHLAALMKRLQDRGVIDRLVTKLQLCEAAYPKAVLRARQASAEDSARRSGGASGRVLLAVGMLQIILGLGWGSLVLLDYYDLLDFFDAPPGEPTAWSALAIVLSIFLVLGVALVFWGGRLLRRGRAARELRLHGLPMKAQVVATSPTGVKVNGLPEWTVELTVRPPDRPPYDAATKLLLGTGAAGELKPGVTVYVRVDPRDPSRVLIETYS